MPRWYDICPDHCTKNALQALVEDKLKG